MHTHTYLTYIKGGKTKPTHIHTRASACRKEENKTASEMCKAGGRKGLCGFKKKKREGQREEGKKRETDRLKD